MDQTYKLDNPKKPKNDVRVFVYRKTKEGNRFTKFNLRSLKSLRITVKVGDKKYQYLPELFKDKIEKTKQGKEIFIQMLKQASIKQFESPKIKQEEMYTEYLRSIGKHKEIKKGKQIVKEGKKITKGIVPTYPVIVGNNKKISYEMELGQRVISGRIKKSIIYRWDSNSGFAQSEFLMGIDIDRFYTDKKYKNVSVDFKMFFKDQYGRDQKGHVKNINIKKQLNKDIEDNMEKFNKGFKISLTNFLYYGMRSDLAKGSWTMTPKKYRVYTALNELGEKVKRQRKSVSKYYTIEKFSFILEVSYTE